MLCAPVLVLGLLRPTGGPAALGAGSPQLRPIGRPCALRHHPSPSMGLFDSLPNFQQTFESLTDWRVARASHILVKAFDSETLDQMNTWKAQIADDEDKFAECARENSQCPSRAKGGDLGFFTRGKMVREFDSVVFNEDPGRVYGPVRTDFGNHLIFLHSCRNPEQK